jgi:hypothetical protein
MNDLAYLLAAGALFLGAVAVFLMVVRRDSPLPPIAQDTRPVHLPVIHDSAKKCGTCEHFDLEAGQIRMRKQPVFASMVAPYVSPNEYDVKVTAVAPNAEGVLENAAVSRPDIPEQCNWTRFGLCLKHNEGLWDGTTAKNRERNMADLTAGGDCYEPKVDA